jgi:hypothetical protein
VSAEVGTSGVPWLYGWLYNPLESII